MDGRVALVTGAGRGIGRATAVRLARDGAHIVACDVGDRHSVTTTAFYGLATDADLQETARLVGEVGRRCIAATVDVRDIGQVRSAVSRTIDEFGRIDILASVAGIASFAPLPEMTDAQWDQMIGVNLTGPANCVRAVVEPMIDAAYGRIVIVASVAGRRGQLNTSHYVASKWGVIGFMKAASLELYPHGITVNVVNPGSVDTPMVRSADNQDFNARMRAQGQPSVSPQNRMPPEAIADGIAYLAADSSNWISGETLDIAGGLNAAYTA
jgi:NAD(P)-dependent dehydrogenase (short-subunit alcohol dehydrogenase family)